MQKNDEPFHTFRFLLAALALVALLVLSGCAKKPGGNPLSPQQYPGFHFPQAKPDQNAVQAAGSGVTAAPGQGQAISDCLKQPNEALAEQCLTGLAAQDKNAATCDQLKVLSKDTCYKGVAIAASDKLVCGKIGDLQARDQCNNAVGTATKDIGLCFSITDSGLKDSCISSVAMATNSWQGCRNISNTASHDSCLEAVAATLHDLSVCDYVSPGFTSAGFERDKCYSGASSDINGEECPRFMADSAKASCFSAAKNKPAAGMDCSTLTDTGARNACYFWLARATGQASYCYKAQDTNTSDCLAQLLTTSTGEKQCLDITDPGLEATCLYNWAADTNNAENCLAITGNAALRNSCVTSVATTTKDVNACAKITASSLTDNDDCLTAVALAAKDYTMCQGIKTDKRYYTCFEQVALQFSAPEICEKAAKQMVFLPYVGREYCYEQYAFDKKDASVCSHIDYNSLRVECTTNVTGQ